ncbi:LuxR C-terminal-related transcriptional regulator [Hoeflea poritis]|uniref:LuxR C-terminal-related transcriptional regulator n=1 Tax=Hoeflea poritis TaxID=2993659 RepID=A0ABT4VPL2_9HYPH|nr:LuxR C-terminal-related transcriptional regulator [Hoeflea poritis]MDA4846648.1 LuxR C-terminal-related transcriptional regulator [Hoeflea poritis]
MNQDIRDAILRIYDTVADQAIWSDVLDRLADRLNARGCLIFELGNDGLSAHHTSSWYEETALQEYLETHQKSELTDHEVFRRHSFSHDSVDIVPDSVLYDDIAEFTSRKNVRHVMRFGILHRAAALLNKDNPFVSRFSVQFRSDRNGISDSERAYLNQLLPHIAKALDLGRPASDVARQHSGILAALNKLTIGVCLLDPQGRLVVANDEFLRQQETYTVFDTLANGQLALRNDRDQQRFVALREDALNHGKFGARPRKEAIMTDNAGFLCIEIAPLNRSEEIGSQPFEGCILYSLDTSLPLHFHTQPLKQAYNLTEAELSLVEAIAEGLTNVQIAERRGRAVATVNAQVKSILSKTNCATRTQFVRLLSGFGADFTIGDSEKRY